MMEDLNRSDITQLLNQLGSTSQAATERPAPNQLMPLVYDELRAMADQQLRREQPGHTLQATALVHEAYLRLVDQSRIEYNGRTHFFALCSTMIRRILVDHARAKMAIKRGGEQMRLTLSGDEGSIDPNREIDVLELDEAMNELASHNERQARVVDLRFFGGMSVEDTAAALNISPRTVKDDWRFARAWLRQRLGRE